MRFVSFNANGIRARMHQLAAIREQHDPDVLALQEIKVADDQFPVDEVRALGFEHVHYFGQKGHYGVALLSKAPPVTLTLGIPWRASDQQRRLISATYATGGRPMHVLNGYFPQGESRDHPTKFADKQQFYADIGRFLAELCDPAEPVLVAGDMNVAPDDADIGIGDDNRKRWLRSGKCCFLPEERDWLQNIMDWGLEDGYAQRRGDDARRYSWFDYRSRGFEQQPRRGLRIDLILTSPPLTERLIDCGVDYDIRSIERPSDHCPVWCEFDL